jgi:hypothetical protein
MSQENVTEEELERMWKESTMVLPGGTEKTSTNLRQDNQLSDRGWNPGPRKYEPRVMTHRP